jgi:hypothetical protein
MMKARRKFGIVHVARMTRHYKATPHGKRWYIFSVHIIVREAVGCMYGESVCAPCITELRADFDSMAGSPKIAVCVMCATTQRPQGRGASAAALA